MQVNPLSSRSSFSAVYFLYFKVWADSEFCSKLHVNSSNTIFFSALLISTRSGLDVVVRMSGGIVEPFRSCSGMSANTSIFSGLSWRIDDVMCLSTEL